MAEKLINFIKQKNGIKILIIIGICGMVLIALSEILPQKKDTEIKVAKFDEDAYCKSLEEKVKKIVTSITGDKNAVAVVTLDTGVKYYYAGETENKQGEKSSENTQNTVTVKTADGGETAVVVNSKMPEVRGVAIVCNTDSETAEKVLTAVTSALNITSKHCSVSIPKQ